MVDDNTPCIAGCKIYSGHERKHHKDCPYYPESFSQRFDELQAENKRLKEIIKDVRAKMREIKYYKGKSRMHMLCIADDVESRISEALKG